ncbi:VCBS repeat-containing protein, partial [bacterium]|nr:VCBS repeat-containing protein [bacterium]
VEDHYLQFSRSFDFGDLPAGYNLTETADNGARHELQNTGQIYLGLAIDAELDGQESTDAGRASSSGDDNTSGTDDEDGVLVMGYWHDGTNGGSVQVIVTGSSGYLSGWIDWNDDNDFADTGEQIFNMQAVTAGVNVLSFDIPAGAIPSNGTYNRFGRFRLDDSNTSAMTTTGLVTNGEVEDHYLQFSRNFDFGDLPADYNLTEAVDNGARHELQYTGQIYLGPAIDTELDGQESIDAGRAADSGDDNSSGSDDEDGVSVVDGWLEGTNGGAVEVFVTGGSGYLSAWIDWNDDNDFADTGEQIFNMQAVAEGADTLSFDIPAGGIPTPDTYNRFSRFRLDDSNTVAMTTTGLVTNGEVEDHYLQFTGFNLVVVSHTPAQNTIDVSVSSSLSMTFSKNINAATLNDDITFNVDGSLSGEHQGVFSGGGTSTITFDPTNDFEVGEVVTITLTTGIQSTDATPLDAPYTSQFFVEAPFGSCTFMDSGNNLGSYQSYDISLGDLDGDGDLDAFVANSNNQANKVWKNDGNGIFTDSGQNLGLADSYDVSLGDLDGDGDLDAFVATMFGQYSKVWLNDGNGIFTDSGQNLGLTNSTCVSLGDLDGDGDLDAFVANHNTYNKVWLNNGSGTFTDSGQNLGLSSNSYGVSLGDLDGDGDLDAFVANYKDKNIVWLNNGSGTFTDNGQTLGNSQSRGVSLGDLDSDGDLDAFVVNFDEANIVWKNAGNGHFTDSGQSLGNSSSTGFSLGDLNGDGDLDAFVANYDQANKVWINYFEARLQAKIFLEGPYDDTANEMSTAINGSIPLTSPYSEDARTVADIPSTITDWVLVELRSTADGSTVRSRSAFLRKDGLIVADDGTTEYITVDAAAGDYFIVIRHRNHLAVMSDEVHALAAGNSTLYNFTTGLDKYYGGEAAVVESGVYGMYAGDPNCSSGVNATDYMTVKIVNGSNGYFSEDCNLSGGVNSTDYMVIKPNSGKTCNVQ